jgi:hypothetical protein
MYQFSNLNMRVLSTVFTMMTFLISASTPVWASSNQVSTLEIPLPGGGIPSALTFSVYEQEGIRYFSAGMGKEERSLVYPPYSAKLIFVKGKRAFLAGVTVEIATQDGSPLVTIPANEVQGPWLFIDLPKGRYQLTATDSQGIALKRSMTVRGDSTHSIHFRWP